MTDAPTRCVLPAGHDGPHLLVGAPTSPPPESASPPPTTYSEAGLGRLAARVELDAKREAKRTRARKQAAKTLRDEIIRDLRRCQCLWPLEKRRDTYSGHDAACPAEIETFDAKRTDTAARAAARARVDGKTYIRGCAVRRMREDGMTWRAIADALGVSYERARQIAANVRHTDAMQKRVAPPEINPSDAPVFAAVADAIADFARQ